MARGALLRGTPARGHVDGSCSGVQRPANSSRRRRRRMRSSSLRRTISKLQRLGAQSGHATISKHNSTSSLGPQLSPPLPPSEQKARRRDDHNFRRPAASLRIYFSVSRAKGASFGPLRGCTPRRAAPARRVRLRRTDHRRLNKCPLPPNCTGHGITRVRRRGDGRPSAWFVQTRHARALAARTLQAHAEDRRGDLRRRATVVEKWEPSRGEWQGALWGFLVALAVLPGEACP